VESQKMSPKALSLKSPHPMDHMVLAVLIHRRGRYSPDRAEDIAATVREKITPAVLGMSPTNINRLSDIMGSLQDIQIGARAAVEMAAIELTCRRLGISLCDFLGGAVSDHVAFNGWVGELPAERSRA
jgi:L-alanine-DL-glutamate epimerase-like enolase superfamily enzyme